MSVVVVASGIDTLNLSVRGLVRGEAWRLLEEAKELAQRHDEPAPVDFPLTGQAFAVRPYGWRGYTIWASSPDFELMIGRSERFPAVVVQMHSAYLHSLGVEPALRLVELLLRHELLSGPAELVASRIDVYADFQGWDPEIVDLKRFVCRGRGRRLYVEHESAYAQGRRLTGFSFGRRALMARLYDKTHQVAQRGLTWVAQLWRGRDPDRPVWRLELQYQRPALQEFKVRTVDEVLAAVQDLWDYGTGSWLSLRRPTADRRERRWPVDPVWEALRAVRLSPARTGVIRRRLRRAPRSGSCGSSWGG